MNMNCSNTVLGTLALLTPLVAIFSCLPLPACAAPEATSDVPPGIVRPIAKPMTELMAEPTAATRPIKRISRTDAACIFELASSVGLGPLDRIAEPDEHMPPGDDCCSVFERAEKPAPDVTRYRILNVVRERNEHYDQFEPGTWVPRGGWKASPALSSRRDCSTRRSPVSSPMNCLVTLPLRCVWRQASCQAATSSSAAKGSA